MLCLVSRYANTMSNSVLNSTAANNMCRRSRLACLTLRHRPVCSTHIHTTTGLNMCETFLIGICAVFTFHTTSYISLLANLALPSSSVPIWKRPQTVRTIYNTYINTNIHIHTLAKCQWHNRLSKYSHATLLSLSLLSFILTPPLAQISTPEGGCHLVVLCSIISSIFSHAVTKSRCGHSCSLCVYIKTYVCDFQLFYWLWWLRKKEGFLNNLRKATISLVTSVRLFVCMGTARVPMDGI
jgi:hypothetical protein